MLKPLAIELFCGLFGWGEGLLQEGWQTIGFDIEDMHASLGIPRPSEYTLVLQDVRTLHGSQFRDAALIVASPPCQAYSYRAMPWSRAKALPPPDNTLFNACFRIQREAYEATGRRIPLIVENVCGAQKWVGRAAAHFGSYYLWGDVPLQSPALPGLSAPREQMVVPGAATKVPGFRFDGQGSFQSAAVKGAYKSAGMNWSDRTKRGQDFTRIAAGCKGIPHRTAGHCTNQAEHDGVKHRDPDGYERSHPAAFGWKAPRTSSNNTSARKAASAMIAKIPLPLARHIARTFHP